MVFVSDPLIWIISCPNAGKVIEYSGVMGDRCFGWSLFFTPICVSVEQTLRSVSVMSVEVTGFVYYIYLSQNNSHSPLNLHKFTIHLKQHSLVHLVSVKIVHWLFSKGNEISDKHACVVQRARFRPHWHCPLTHADWLASDWTGPKPADKHPPWNPLLVNNLPNMSICTGNIAWYLAHNKIWNP